MRPQPRAERRRCVVDVRLQLRRSRTSVTSTASMSPSGGPMRHCVRRQLTFMVTTSIGPTTSFRSAIPVISLSTPTPAATLLAGGDVFMWLRLANLDSHPNRLSLGCDAAGFDDQRLEQLRSTCACRPVSSIGSKGRKRSVCTGERTRSGRPQRERRRFERRRLRTRSQSREMFLTRLHGAATLDCTSSSASLLASGGKEVMLRNRFMNNSNWPLGTRVDICA